MKAPLDEITDFKRTKVNAIYALLKTRPGYAFTYAQVADVLEYRYLANGDRQRTRSKIKSLMYYVNLLSIEVNPRWPAAICPGRDQGIMLFDMTVERHRTMLGDRNVGMVRTAAGTLRRVEQETAPFEVFGSGPQKDLHQGVVEALGCLPDEELLRSATRDKAATTETV